MAFSKDNFRRNPQEELKKCTIPEMTELAKEYGIPPPARRSRDDFRSDLIDGFIRRAMELSEKVNQIQAILTTDKDDLSGRMGGMNM